MDETQHFCLRWNNYQSSITSAFENLRDDEDFVDVTLACEGRSIKAHRVVLSACSPYFRDLLKSTPCKHPVILLQDVNFHDLHSLVEFIYHGEVNVHQKSLQSFLKTAEVLRVSGLTQQQAEETHNQLAQMQNLAGSDVRSPLNAHPNSHQHQHHQHQQQHHHHHHGNNVHIDDQPQMYTRNTGTGTPPPPPLPMQLPSAPTQLPLASTHINSQLFKRSIAAAAMLRRDRNSSTPTAEDPNNTLKRMRQTDNGNGIQHTTTIATATATATNNNNTTNNNNIINTDNCPDIVHHRHLHHTTSPQLTPTDFSTIKNTNNNNSPPPTKDEKHNGPTSNNNAISNNQGNNTSANSNGTTTVKCTGRTLTPSPLIRSIDDVKSEPMELVCPNNNTINEHSNDSTDVHDQDHDHEHDHDHDQDDDLDPDDMRGRISSGECGKISLSSGNDDDIESSMPPHSSTAPPFLISPADSKLFPTAPFTFPMSNLDPVTFASLNPQLQTAADLAASPQGGSTKLIGGVNPNNNSNHHHSSHLHHHDHHHLPQHHHQQHQQSSCERLDHTNQDTVICDERSYQHQHQRDDADKQHITAEQKQVLDSFSSTPSPQQQQKSQLSAHTRQSPSIHYTHAHFGHQHPLSLLPGHHLHARHDLSPSGHHHTHPHAHPHLSRAPSPLEHHHLMQHRRSSLSPSPTGRSSNSASAAGILSSSRPPDLGGPSRLLLPLPLNACHRCDVCGKLLSTKLTLKRHKEQQHLQPLNNAVCNLCHKVFRTLNSLNNHKSIYHRRQKHHSYFHHSGVGGGGSSSSSTRLHQSLSSLNASASNANIPSNNNGSAVAAAAAAAAAAAELLLAGGGPTMQLTSHRQQSSPNLVKPCMDYL